MKDEIRYVTHDEQELYERLAKKYNIKGYSSAATVSILCREHDMKKMGLIDLAPVEKRKTKQPKIK